MTKVPIYLLLKDLTSKILISTLTVILVVCCRTQEIQWKNRKENKRAEIVSNESLLRIEGVSTSDNYGYKSSEPIKLGVSDFDLSPGYPVKYFNSLTCSLGEELTYKRVRSCCPFKTVNSDKDKFKNVAVLEVFSVQCRHKPEITYLFVNFFDEGPVLAPKGFKYKSL